MMRIPIASLLTLAALAALAPTVSATCLDTSPDDDGVGSDGCTVPVLGECNVHVLAYGEIPGSGGSCDAVIQCFRECGPPTSGAALATPCSNDLDPTDDDGVLVRCTVAGAQCQAGLLTYGSLVPRYGCQGPIYCITEPCWFPYPIQ